MKGNTRVSSYLSHDPEWQVPAFNRTFERAAKPEIRALVETVEDGSKVIWLFDGFPVDRSSYGRITLAHVARRAPAPARVCEDPH